MNEQNLIEEFNLVELEQRIEFSLCSPDCESPEVFECREA